MLERELALEVKPMLILDLKSGVRLLVEKNQKINLVTTGFHVNEVRSAAVLSTSLKNKLE